jgi:hypothetical protein
MALERVLVSTVNLVNTITNPTESDRREALAWLAGALRWEGELADLRGEPTADARTADTDTPAQPERRPEAA